MDPAQVNLFSNLDQLIYLKDYIAGVYTLKLEYPRVTEDKPFYTWKQTSNPLTDAKVTGYVAIDHPMDASRYCFRNSNFHPISFLYSKAISWERMLKSSSRNHNFNSLLSLFQILTIFSVGIHKSSLGKLVRYNFRPQNFEIIMTKSSSLSICHL